MEPERLASRDWSSSSSSSVGRTTKQNERIKNGPNDDSSSSSARLTDSGRGGVPYEIDLGVVVVYRLRHTAIRIITDL